MPIPLGAIFFQYMLLWKRLSAHYFSAYVFNCLLYGEPIKPIPKLQVINGQLRMCQTVLTSFHFKHSIPCYQIKGQVCLPYGKHLKSIYGIQDPRKIR